VRHPEKIEDFYEEVPYHWNIGKPLVRLDKTRNLANDTSKTK